ncbi:MAG: polymer-forming cytoskeletal protein [Lachnospiraceae bacterium]
MGFFQDLKEDLSMAVNELIPEADEELAVSEENGEKEEKETDGETTQEAAVVVNEDVFRAAVERLDENADVFADSSMQESEEESAVPTEEEIEKQIEEQTVQQQDEQPEEPVDEPAADEPIIAEPEMPNEDISDSLVKEVCAEVEHADEETELEKEVGKVMTQQSETVLKGEAADETAIITNGMKVTGDISSQGSLDVLGAVKGNIEILGKLNISGEVEGNSIAAEVFADSANITGEIHASGSVKVGQSSVIIGNIFANSAVIAGAVKGDIDVQGPVVLDTSAIVMGNIKSKSVQINNGAVIEGMCSQCYADVNPASFFQDLNK